MDRLGERERMRGRRRGMRKKRGNRETDRIEEKKKKSNGGNKNGNNSVRVFLSFKDQIAHF